MAKGRERHQARIDAINLLGKDLARRARRKCELCESGGELRPFDTAPDDEPSLDTLVLLCNRCRGLAEGGTAPAAELRFLEVAIWSEVPPIASTAKRVIANVDADWARAALEMIS
ncbi:MAG: hypothetical protein AAGF12_02560 [Myxococcota bacterium]